MSAAQRLDEVFGLPEGSEVYVLNDFKSSAYDAVRLFETLGLNQFRYIPFYPGAKDEGVARPLITFGEYDDQCHYLPRCIEKDPTLKERRSFIGGRDPLRRHVDGQGYRRSGRGLPPL